MARAATLDVELRATGEANVAAALNRVGGQGENMGRRVGLAGRQMASAFENAARSGRLAGESLKQIVAQGAEIGFMFGAGGAAASAVVIGVMAIAEAFDKAKQAAIDARHEMFAAVQAIAETEDEGISKEMLDKQREQLEVEIAAQRANVERIEANKRVAERIERNGYQVGLLNQEWTEQNRILEDLETRLIAIDVAYANIGAKADRQREIDRRRTAREAIGTVAGTVAPQPGINRSPDAFTKLIGDGFGRTVKVPIKVVPVPAPNAMQEAQEALGREITRVAGNLATIIETTFEDSIVNAFSRAFSGEGLKGLFKGFGATIISGLGQVFIELGKYLIAFGTLMEKLKAALTSWLGAGPGAILVGVGLLALGGAMVGAAGGRSMGSITGGGVSGSGASQMENITRIVVDPTRAGGASKLQPTQPIQVTVIGPNDPQAQRQIQELVRNAARRGGIG